MRIVYVAKFDQHNSNDDEDAVAHALTELGHQVIRVDEARGYKAAGQRGDFLLCHKWADTDALRAIKIPKVFWYFDLVDFPDPTLSKRNQTRLNWMRDVLPLVDLGFCTDGDWVSKDTTGKLVHLFQGADARIAGRGQELVDQETPPILFSGIRNGGRGRANFVDEMTIQYSGAFLQVQGVYRQALANLIASTRIVVAPDAPVSDVYWSNRVYMTLGFGGFLLHPYCKLLAEHYEDGKEIMFYRSREELHAIIQRYYFQPEACRAIGDAGLQRTLAQHTYGHRVQELVRIVGERLGVECQKTS